MDYDFDRTLRQGYAPLSFLPFCDIIVENYYTRERRRKLQRSGLSFGDGFQFGCGFMVAVLIFWIVLSIVMAIIALVFGLFAGQALPDLLQGGQLIFPLFFV